MEKANLPLFFVFMAGMVPSRRFMTPWGKPKTCPISAFSIFSPTCWLFFSDAQKLVCSRLLLKTWGKNPNGGLLISTQTILLLSVVVLGAGTLVLLHSFLRIDETAAKVVSEEAVSGWPVGGVELEGTGAR